MCRWQMILVILLLLCSCGENHSQKINSSKALDIKKLIKLKENFSEEQILTQIAKYGIKGSEVLENELDINGFSAGFIEKAIEYRVAIPQRQRLPSRISRHYVPQKNAPNAYVVAIGINKYKHSDGLPFLPSPTTNVEDFVKRLLKLGLPPQQVDLLTGSYATQESVDAAIERATTKGEMLYVFFSGHGMTQDGKYFLCCYDSDSNDIVDTGYLIDDLKVKISNGKNKQVLVLLDACHSGNMMDGVAIGGRRGSGAKSMTFDKDIYNKLRDLDEIEKPILLVTSCKEEEKSLSGTKYSFFGESLIEAVNGKADDNRDAKLSPKEIAHYIRDRVTEKTHGKQNPDYKLSKGWEWDIHMEREILNLDTNTVAIEESPVVNKVIEKAQPIQEVSSIGIELQQAYKTTMKKAQNSSVKDQLAAWLQFYELYWDKYDPGNQKQVQIVKDTRDRIRQLKNKLQQLAKILLHADKYNCNAGETISLRVEAVRVNGEKFNTTVRWQVKYGRVDNGVYIAPARSCTDEVIAIAEANYRIRSRISITVNKKKKPSGPAGFTYLRTRTYTCNGNTYSVKEYRHNRTGMEFVKIPGGSFTMGGDNGGDDEKPAHRVTLDSFLLCKTEVTQGVWQKVMGTTPWKGKYYVKEGSNYAATYVSWNDAKDFCDRVGLQLPTEAQWEYACRSGSSGKYYWGNNMNGYYAWYNKNAYDVGNKYAHQVAQKKPNAFGLYDMSGNVYEWCHDWYDENYYSNSPPTNPKGPNSDFFHRVYRGGCWSNDSGYCRSRYRYINRSFGNNWGPSARNSYIGFRPCAQKIEISLVPKPEEKKIVPIPIELKTFSDADTTTPIKVDILTVDDRSYTPDFKILPGKYTVIAYTYGHQLYQKDIEITNDKDVFSAKIVLESTLRTLRVKYEYDVAPAAGYPDCEVVMVDTVTKKSFAPTNGQMVKPGKYKVSVQQKGYTYTGVNEVFIESGVMEFELKIPLLLGKKVDKPVDNKQ